MEKRFGKLIIASFIVMAIGIILFLLTPLLYGNFGIDTDIIGLSILILGLAICIIGIIHRRKPHGWKLIFFSIIAAILCVPIIILIVTTIMFLITDEPV